MLHHWVASVVTTIPTGSDEEVAISMYMTTEPVVLPSSPGISSARSDEFILVSLIVAQRYLRADFGSRCPPTVRIVMRGDDYASKESAPWLFKLMLDDFRCCWQGGPAEPC